MTSLRIDPLAVEKVSNLIHEREEGFNPGNYWEQEDWEVVEVIAYREDLLHEEGNYFYECYAGHTGKVPPQSDLELECIQLGAHWMTVRMDDCPTCLAHRREEELKCAMFGFDPYGEI